MARALILVIVTGILNGFMMGLAWHPVGAVVMGLAAVAVWLWARKRERWAKPLGIIWLVFGIMMCLSAGSLNDAVVRRGDPNAAPLGTGSLVGGVVLTVFGALMIGYRKLRGKHAGREGSQSEFDNALQRGDWRKALSIADNAELSLESISQGIAAAVRGALLKHEESVVDAFLRSVPLQPSPRQEAVLAPAGTVLSDEIQRRVADGDPASAVQLAVGHFPGYPKLPEIAARAVEQRLRSSDFLGSLTLALEVRRKRLDSQLDYRRAIGSCLDEAIENMTSGLADDSGTEVYTRAFLSWVRFVARMHEVGIEGQPKDELIARFTEGLVNAAVRRGLQAKLLRLHTSEHWWPPRTSQATKLPNGRVVMEIDDSVRVRSWSHTLLERIGAGIRPEAERLRDSGAVQVPTEVPGSARDFAAELIETLHSLPLFQSLVGAGSPHEQSELGQALHSVVVLAGIRGALDQEDTMKPLIMCLTMSNAKLRHAAEEALMEMCAREGRRKSRQEMIADLQRICDNYERGEPSGTLGGAFHAISEALAKMTESQAPAADFHGDDTQATSDKDALLQRLDDWAKGSQDNQRFYEEHILGASEAGRRRGAVLEIAQDMGLRTEEVDELVNLLEAEERAPRVTREASIAESDGSLAEPPASKGFNTVIIASTSLGQTPMGQQLQERLAQEILTKPRYPLAQDVRVKTISGPSFPEEREEALRGFVWGLQERFDKHGGAWRVDPR